MLISRLLETLMDLTRPTGSRWLEYGLLVLAAGTTANSLMGPLGTGTIAYHYSETLVNQGIGLDAVALIASVPMAVFAAVLLFRAHPAGAVVALVPATFSAYMIPQYVVGPDYLHLPGNNEQFFLFHVSMFVLAVVLAIGAWVQIDGDTLRPDSVRADRMRSWVMFGVAAFILFGRWLPAIVELSRGRPRSVDFVENPTAYLLIGILDLGLVVPAAVAAGVGLWGGAAWGRKAGYAVMGWFALVPAAVAAMAITMQLRGDPNAETATTVLFVVAASVFTFGAGLLYRPMFTSQSLVATGEVKRSEVVRGTF